MVALFSPTGEIVLGGWGGNRHVSCTAQACKGILERFAVQVVLSMLERFSTADKDSNELLNYGIFVRATKRPPAVASVKSSS